VGGDDGARGGRRAGRTLKPAVSARVPVGTYAAMWLLILLILALILFGVWGAIKLAFWVLLIALAVALVVGFLGRGLFGSRRSAL